MDVNQIYNNFKYQNVLGKYISNAQYEIAIIPFQNLFFKIGKSVSLNPIYSFKIGYGTTKILLWSNMHGNEPTTTKAVVDFLYFINSNHKIAIQTQQKFTFVIIPILNPDGVNLYTRENVNNIDINRDFINQSQPETQFLLEIYNVFKPHFCFNLHDQRSIFAAGTTSNPATISFLAPSYNITKDYNQTRLKAIDLIIFLNQNLQNYIPNYIGRFDDSFNSNCAGDYFTSQNTPTILIEAGHFPNDYNRESTRKYIFFTLFYTLFYDYENEIVNNVLPNYLSIPQNFISFYDIIIKNVKYFLDNSFFITNFALQYKEVLIDNEIQFIAYIAEIGNLSDKKSHLELNAKQKIINTLPKIGEIANFEIDKINFKNGKLI